MISLVRTFRPKGSLQVVSASMRLNPTRWSRPLRGGRDYALLAPVTAYQGEGIYLLDDGLALDLYRVTNTLEKGGALSLSRENPRYGTKTIDREEFNERVVGIVVADIRVRSERFLGGL